jgi:hypothetical protein
MSNVVTLRPVRLYEVTVEQVTEIQLTVQATSNEEAYKVVSNLRYAEYEDYTPLITEGTSVITKVISHEDIKTNGRRV